MVVEGTVTEDTLLYKQEEVDKIKGELKERYRKEIEEIKTDVSDEEKKSKKWNNTIFQISLLLNAFIIGFTIINNSAWPFALSIFSYFKMDGEGIAKLLVTIITLCVTLLFLIWQYSRDVTIPFVVAGLFKKTLLEEWNIGNKIKFVYVTSKGKMRNMGVWKTKDKTFFIQSREAALNLPHNIPGAIVLSEYGFAMQPSTILSNAPYFDPVSVQSYADITEADAMDKMSGKIDYKIFLYIGVFLILAFFAYSFWQQRAGCETNAAQLIEMAKICGQATARTVGGGTPI